MNRGSRDNMNKPESYPRSGEGITWWEYPEPENPEETVLYGPYGTLVAQVRLRKQSPRETDFFHESKHKKRSWLLRWWLGG